jgi:hypothetical protein
MGKLLSDRARLTLLLIYSVAGWGSLFWINGILSWQLTPWGVGPNTESSGGFFNADVLALALYRTIACMVIAGLVAAVIVNTMTSLDREDRTRLIHHAARFMLPILAMPVVGLWFLAALPEDSRGWVMGGSIAMTMFLNLAVGASALIGGYVVVGLWKQRLTINGATATLLLALAFGASAGGEFVREGARKPYTIRERSLLQRDRRGRGGAPSRGRLHHARPVPTARARMPNTSVDAGRAHLPQPMRRFATPWRASTRSDAPDGLVDDRAAAHERGEAAVDQGLHAALCRDGRRARGAGAARTLGTRKATAQLSRVARPEGLGGD